MGIVRAPDHSARRPVRLFRFRPDTGVRSHLSASPDFLELGGLPLHGYHLHGYHLLSDGLCYAGSSSETFLLVRWVAYATQRTRHLCLFRQREDEESVSSGRPEHSRYEPFGPSAPPDRHGYVLSSVDAVGSWAAVVAASTLELPQMLPGARIECVELPRRLAGEHEVATRGQHRRAHRQVIAPAPHLLARGRIEGAHGPCQVLLLAGSGVHDDGRSPVRNALLELPAPPRDLHTDILYRDVEEPRPRAVGRVRPFLAAGRPRPKGDRLPLVLGVHLGRYLAVGADLAPGDTVDEGCYPDQLAVRTIQDEEVPVLVEVRQQLAPVQVEEDVLHGAVVVPQVVRVVLIVPAYLAVVRVHGDDAVGVEVVALADASVEVGRRVAGPPVQEVQLRVVGAGDPAVSTTPCPGFTFGGPGLGTGLPGLRNRVAAPDALSGLDVVGVEVAAHAEFPAGAPHDDYVLHDEGSDCGALTSPHVTVHGVPDQLAGFRVEREHVGVQGGDEDLPLCHGDPAVDVAAAERHIVRDRMLVSPQLLPGPGVEGPDPAIPARDV